MASEEIQQQVVSELRVLEELRRHHLTTHPDSALDRDDPDVQRMIEALALFSVRTRMSLQRNLQATWRRLFASYFDFLLAPLPSCAIAQATVSPRLVETLTVDRGTELRITTASGKTASFTALADLRILPITLESVEEIKQPGDSRLLLRFTSRYPRTDAVGLLRLFLHCAGHYESALGMLYQLRAHLVRATVVYDPAAAPGEGRPCEVSFGSLFAAPLDGELENPAESVRRFFFFPERELYLNVSVPRSERPWSTFVLALELGPDFAPELSPGRDSFQLFTVPIENRVRQLAAQITCDGTATSYGIRHVDPTHHFSLMGVRGVNRLTERGSLPLRPAALSAADSEDSYEVEERGDGDRAGHFLLVRMPRALLKPAKLQLDCDWHQPWFAREAVGKLRVTTPQRSLDGVSLQVLGAVRAPALSPMQSDTQGLLLLLALRMKPVLSCEELRRVLDILGVCTSGAYRRIPALLRDLRVEAALDSALRGSGMRHVYTAALERFPPHDEPLVWHFLEQIQKLLDLWNAEASVDLRVEAGSPAFAAPLPKALP